MALESVGCHGEEEGARAVGAYVEGPQVSSENLDKDQTGDSNNDQEMGLKADKFSRNAG